MRTRKELLCANGIFSFNENRSSDLTISVEPASCYAKLGPFIAPGIGCHCAIGSFLIFIRTLFVSISVRVDYNSSLLLCRVDKKRDKLDRQVLDSQERAFWDVHRPAVSRALNY